MKTSRSFVFLLALGGLMVSSCGIDQVQNTDQSHDESAQYIPYSYYEESSTSAITDVSHGEPTLDFLDFALLEDGKSYAVSGGSDRIPGDIVIPATYNGLPVTHIKEMGFRSPRITTLYIPKGVTTIEEDAIYWCDNLETLFIPSTVNNIALRAIEGCPKLNIIVSDENACFSSLNGALYDKNKTKIIRAPRYIDGFVFPRTVKRIHPEAFLTCENLKSIIIPEGITSIGEAAFTNSGLVEVKISKTVESIDERVFSYCKSLEHVNFCYDGKSSESHLISICKEAFYWCKGLQDVTLPDHVESIGDEAFKNCNKVKSLSLGQELVTIGDEAFDQMSSIKEVTLPKTVESIGKLVFAKCPELKSILVEDGNPNFSSFDGALYSKNLATLIRRPEGKTTILFPLGLKNFQKGACQYSALRYVRIPDSVESLADHLFYECASLATVSLPNTITSIPDYAFGKCSSLTYFTIDKNIETIGDWAFYDCKTLFGIEIQNGVSVIGYSAFDGCKSLASLSFPDSVTEVGSNCFFGCHALESVAFGSGIRSVKDYAFAECDSLSTMTYSGTVEKWSEVARGGAWVKNTKITSVTCADGEGTIAVSSYL